MMICSQVFNIGITKILKVLFTGIMSIYYFSICNTIYVIVVFNPNSKSSTYNFSILLAISDKIFLLG